MNQRKAQTRSFAGWVIAVMLTFAFAACGGGNADSGSPQVTKMLSWAPPTAYQDNSALDPMHDLAGYNIYIKSASAPFSDNDVESAFASPADTSIDLIPVCRIQGLPPGTYHVSVRAIANNGLKSDFSPAAAFKL